MWVPLFTIVLTIALGFGLGAVMLESYGDESHRGRRPVRSYRPTRH